MPSGEDVYANDLINVLKMRHASGTFDRLVSGVNLEACESGSMFDGLLPEGLDIYVTTASKPDENSWATDVHDRTADSVAGQYDRVRACTIVANRTAANLTHGFYGSHIMEYGDIVV
ncbi:vacuolar-processing enzyme alpha-isozyme-like [Nicotiana sylvestris]|uniref:vacuolar-processing enzyme alpha-isozyme-like n=1 Tax=Nicotiana sylvestris TaxID=4096 RepID=UPI00388CC66D